MKPEIRPLTRELNKLNLTDGIEDEILLLPAARPRNR